MDVRFFFKGTPLLTFGFLFLLLCFFGEDPKHDIRLHLMRNDFMLDMQKGPAEGAMVQIELILVFDQSPAS